MYSKTSKSVFQLQFLVQIFISISLPQIDVQEVEDLLASRQSYFPNASLVWLKDLLAYLNMKIPIERDDPTFAGKASTYPTSIVPKALRMTLEKAIVLAGAENVQLFYEFVLMAMVTDSAKGVPVVGNKIFVQLLAKHNPKMAVANIAKLTTLRNSYQNRKNICLSLLWALQQSGFEDLSVGLKVWHEVMASLLEARSYSGHVVGIVNDILSHHEKNATLTSDLYLNIVEDVLSGSISVPVAQAAEGLRVSEKLRVLF